VAARNLHLGSAGYGLLLGMVGVGAVTGALVIPRLRARVGSARLVTGATFVAAAAIGLVATFSNAVLVGIALVPVGGAWIAVMSSLNSGLQLALSNWVRARGLAYYLAVFQGTQAVGAVIWGVVADRTSVTTALLLAAAVLALGAVLGLRAPMPDTSKLDRTPSAHWPAPQLMFTPNADDGPVLVTLTYRVPEHNVAAFTDAMRHVGRSRRRTGALRWELFRDGAEPTKFVESYLVGTWAEHLRQREHRLTGADRRFEEEAQRYALGAPQVAHLSTPLIPADDAQDAPTHPYIRFGTLTGVDQLLITARPRQFDLQPRPSCRDQRGGRSAVNPGQAIDRSADELPRPTCRAGRRSSPRRRRALERRLPHP
jgi:quinol monooxygenase YgiN